MVITLKQINPNGTVEGGEHVHHPVVAVIRRALAPRLGAQPPGLALARQQVQRPELVDADHASVGGRVVIQVGDPAHLGDEVRVG
jgi:hypothetical protein